MARTQKTLFTGINEHYTPKSLFGAYLYGFLLLALLLGFQLSGATIFSASESQYRDIWSDRVFLIVVLLAVFIMTARQRHHNTVHLFMDDDKMHFRTADFDFEDIDIVKVRRTYFNDLYTIHVHLKNGSRFRYTCPSNAVELLRNEKTDSKTDYRLSLWWFQFFMNAMVYVFCGYCIGKYFL